MDELGLDFSLVYPTYGLALQMTPDDEMRRAGCRALNLYMAELHREYADRLLPVASLPMHTPQEAIEELEYAVNTLGMRAALIPSYVLRPIDRVHRDHPELDGVAYRPDTYGIDSEHDYDSVWAKFVELKVVPSSHGPSMGVGFRRSVSNYVYNHIGNFAASCEALCKALLMGGVFHRFPTLRIAALEGGMGWAASLYADFLGHWGKRNRSVIDDLDPARIDGELLERLLKEYGNGWVRERLEVVKRSLMPSVTPHQIDEFSACPFESEEQIRDLFTSRIYMGCEADDPMNALAFRAELHPHGARFRIMFGSDISHWDVPDVSDVLVEAYELVERERITDQDFREFACENAARLYAGTNPDFFKGTRVEGAVASLLAASR
jgi:predicted TIM-barrel fold metal-dependent hydrolase